MTVTSSKRIVTFILCLVFCFMFVFPPMPAQAVVGVPALVYGAWAAGGSEIIGSVIAALVMAAAGVSFDNGFFGDTDNLSTMAYEQGYELVRDMILSGGNCAAWVDEVVGLFSISQGFKAGDKIEVPAEVLEYARSWVNSNYDFSNGPVSMSSSGMLLDNGEFFEFSSYGDKSFSQLGTAFYCSYLPGVRDVSSVPVIDFGVFQVRAGGYFTNDALSSYSSSVGIKLKSSSSWKTNGFTAQLIEEYRNEEYVISKFANNHALVLSFDSITSNLYLGFLNYDLNSVSWNGKYITLSSLDSHTSNSSISGSDSLSIPQTEAITITVPDVSMGDISGYSVPAIQQLTGEMVLPAPGAGEVEGDNDDTNIGDLTPDKPFYVPDTWTGFNSWMKTQSENFKAWRDTIGTSIDNLVDDVTDIGTNVNDWITEKWGDFTDTVEGIPDAIATSIENIIASVIDVLSQPAQKLRDKFDNVLNKILPFFQGVGNLGLSFLGIWHYVITWVGTLAPWISTMFMIWNGLPYAMVVPIYATAAVVIVIGIYRRFFM